MKIIKIESKTTHHITTNESIPNNYIRYSERDWVIEMNGYEQQVTDSKTLEQLEKLFQEDLLNRIDQSESATEQIEIKTTEIKIPECTGK